MVKFIDHEYESNDLILSIFDDSFKRCYLPGIFVVSKQLRPQPRQHLSSPGQSLSAEQVVTHGPMKSRGQGGESLSRWKIIDVVKLIKYSSII